MPDSPKLRPFNGRLSRSAFFWRFIVFHAAELFLTFFLVGKLGLAGSLQRLLDHGVPLSLFDHRFTMFFLTVNIFSLIVMLPVIVRRWQDIGWQSSTAVFYYLLSLFLQTLFLYKPIYQTGQLLYIITQLAFYIVLFGKKGKPGSNKYGPDPLARTSP